MTMKMLRGMQAALASADAGGPEDIGLRDDDEGHKLLEGARAGLEWVNTEIHRREERASNKV